jgi:hypothetical protein
MFAPAYMGRKRWGVSPTIAFAESAKNAGCAAGEIVDTSFRRIPTGLQFPSGMRGFVPPVAPACYVFLG